MHTTVGNNDVKLYFGDELLIGDKNTPVSAFLITSSPTPSIVGHVTMEE